MDNQGKQCNDVGVEEFCACMALQPIRALLEAPGTAAKRRQEALMTTRSDAGKVWL
jgi:hypothetical protein